MVRRRDYWPAQAHQRAVLAPVGTSLRGLDRIMPIQNAFLERRLEHLLTLTGRDGLIDATLEPLRVEVVLPIKISSRQAKLNGLLDELD